MDGERMFPNKYGFFRLSDGAYGCDLQGCWWMRPFQGNARKVAQADVLIHPDETITVSGYLQRGQWRTS